MKFILAIALRNLRRHKLRTAVSISAIVIAVVIGIFYRGLLLGYSESTFNNFIQLNSGHLRLVDSEYARRERTMTLFHPVDGWEGEGLEAMRSEIAASEDITGTLPRLRFGAAYARSEDMQHLQGWGVDIEAESQLTDFPRQLSQGRLPEPGTREIALGGRVMDDLGYETGDAITLLYNTAYRSFRGTTFTITGRIETGLPYFDENAFLVSLSQAQEMLDMPGQATELLLFTHDRNNVDPVRGEILSLLEEKGAAERYQLSSWRDAAGIVEWLMAYQRIILIVMAGIVFLGAIVIINTLKMVIKERTKEIGTMSALGLSRREIILLFTAEGGLMGALGSLLGVVIGGGLMAVTSRTGLDFGDVMDAMGGETLIDSVVYPVFSLDSLAVAFIIGLVVSTLSCIIPARRAADIEPSEAMRDL